MTAHALFPRTIPALSHIALIGNALPRRCGIATFTSDTRDGLRLSYPDLHVDLYAMDDATGVSYDSSVHPIVASDPAAYRHAAALIEASGAQAIWLQHEYGIFGGSAGSHILGLIARTTLPLIVTLHTVLEQANPAEHAVLDALARRADQLIVMAERGREILRDIYGVDDARIAVIPHGVPDRPFVDTAPAKQHFGFADSKTILTFGLLAPDKGIDQMIAAMPAIVAEHPDALYIVLGATHPNLVREAGEDYRDSLVTLAARLGVQDHVHFINTFVDQPELLDYLAAADVYVTPYRKRDQITSGTLAYAVGLGKAVVSTPYIHASEILSDGHGILVEFDDPAAMAHAINGLLRDDAGRMALAQRAYTRGRSMIWAASSAAAMQRLSQSLPAVANAARVSATQLQSAAPTLRAVQRMTDGTGMLQHGIHSIPDRDHGYCIDDNARALILVNRLSAAHHAPSGADRQERNALASTYAAFIQHGWNPDVQRYRNFMRYDRCWCEDVGSEDSNGRTIWALGSTAADADAASHRGWAVALFDQSAALTFDLGSPRALAFALLGAAGILAAHPRHQLAHAIVDHVAAILDRAAVTASRPGWTWFEAELAYDNARLCEALIIAGEVLDNGAYRERGLATLAWIVDQQTADAGYFRPVGTDSFFRPRAAPLKYDQQPLEAQATIDACATAYRVTHDARWLHAARTAYRWFLGDNDQGIALASGTDGGCFDGLMPHGVNLNQGAESILALQLSALTISGLPVGVDHVAHSPIAA